jgi:hypothetical protein
LMESVTWCSLVSSGIAFLSIVATDDLPTAIRCAGMRSCAVVLTCGNDHELSPPDALLVRSCVGS